MTIQEYNNDFLPKIERAIEFVTLFESAIRHMDEKRWIKMKCAINLNYVVGQMRPSKQF